ncbi:DDE family transposase [Streptohalobacillus salinus]|uniref:DDE family transposase n=1 Tax=Streptohalobacillus salinus TaxID=621096 RepID=A0A2V3W7T9_9BACI|nr:transposase [Streptohalobacillus salinus]PXW89224.1 DDE family transposase [Streptohalobacillus salinus]
MDHPSSLKQKRANDPLRFVKVKHATTDGEIAENLKVTLDGSLIEKEAQYDGFYGMCTNLTSDPLALIHVNQRRWEIEERFRIMKTELKSRPVYVRNDDRVETHFLTRFLSLLIYRILEQKLDNKFSCQKIIKTLREMNVMKASGEGYIPLYERTHLTDQLHELFGFRTDYEINTINKMKNNLKLSKKNEIVLTFITTQNLSKPLKDKGLERFSLN